MSKLREAAQALLDAYVFADNERWMMPYWDALREALREDALAEMQALTESEYQKLALGCLSNTHQQLDAALSETEDEYEYEYEYIGTIDGTYGGRWMIAAFAENASAVWPDNTAVYVRRKK